MQPAEQLAWAASGQSEELLGWGPTEDKIGGGDSGPNSSRRGSSTPGGKQGPLAALGTGGRPTCLLIPQKPCPCSFCTNAMTLVLGHEPLVLGQ